MDYQQLHHSAIRLVGVGIDTAIGKTQVDCKKAWESLTQRLPEIGNIAEVSVHFGVSTQMNPKTGTMHYTAASEVSTFGPALVGMEQLELPESDYLVFTHKGQLNTLDDTYCKIMTVLQTGGWKRGGFWLERYDSRYQPDSENSEFDILIPVITVS